MTKKVAGALHDSASNDGETDDQPATLTPSEPTGTPPFGKHQPSIHPFGEKWELVKKCHKSIVKPFIEKS